MIKSATIQIRNFVQSQAEITKVGGHSTLHSFTLSSSLLQARRITCMGTLGICPNQLLQKKWLLLLNLVDSKKATQILKKSLTLDLTVISISNWNRLVCFCQLSKLLKILGPSQNIWILPWKTMCQTVHFNGKDVSEMNVTKVISKKNYLCFTWLCG